VQRRQFERQQQTERRITELQISLLKNKLEPHFSINALNSVIQAIREERHEVAEEGLMRFVGMYRHMMFSSDSIDRALDEELAFTESYLELEKLRCEQLFSYQIEVSPGVDHGFRIPKMIIQLHAENAVKHGLAPLKTGGLLHIEIMKPGDQLQITITDNGVGYTKGVQASTNPRSQGLEMMKELYALYHKVSNTKIVSEIEELKDESGVVTGTRVSIRIDKSGDNRNHAIDR
jgi:LytS/YehU family sensor histidine kinase